jgi:asparagine synthetase A
MSKKFIHQFIIEVNINYQSGCPLRLPKDIKQQDNNQMIKKYPNLKKLNKDQNQNKRFKF